MRKTIFAFAATALALWWGFGDVVSAAKQPKTKIQPLSVEEQGDQDDLMIFLTKLVGYIHANHNDLLNRLVDDIRSGKIDVEQAANTLYETMKKEA
jgi:hypothetical protein